MTSLNKETGPVNLEGYMKLSYKLTITLLSIAAPCMILPVFDYLSNQEGKLYEALPAGVKSSGKTVTLKMSSCPKPSTVEIVYFYKIAGAPASQGGLTQIIQFQPSKTSQVVNILAPADQHNAKVMIKIMPKSAWDLNIQSMTIRANKNATPAQKAAAMKLMRQSFHSPTNTLSLEYVDITPKQVITLPYADATTPKVDQMTQSWTNEQFGITYEQLKPYLEKQPGKTVLINIAPPITETMTVSISSKVTKPNGNSANVTQTIMVTPDTDKIEVKIPQPSQTAETTQEIRFSVVPEKIFRKLKTMSLTTRKLSAEEKEEKETLEMLEMGLQSSITHTYATLTDQQKFTLAAPAKKLALVKSLIGCNA